MGPQAKHLDRPLPNKEAPPDRTQPHHRDVPRGDQETYRGWTNRETWAVWYWIQDGRLDYWRAQALAILRPEFQVKRAKRFATADTEAIARELLAEDLVSTHEDELPELSDGYPLSLLHAAMARVNWREIAGVLIKATKPA